MLRPTPRRTCGRDGTTGGAGAGGAAQLFEPAPAPGVQHLADGRESWRRTQTKAAVRDSPEDAASVLRDLGYRVDHPEGGRLTRDGHTFHVQRSQPAQPERWTVSHPASGHSTVTDLARLRGWSTSVPMKTAAMDSKIKICADSSGVSLAGSV